MALATANLHSILHTTFGYTTFRPLQEECIRAVLNKEDAVLIMPTGGGKSLCYQIPAMVLSGLTVVVSPLISLMMDQVRQLKALGVEAEVLNSSLTFEEYNMNKTLVRTGQTKLLFLAPETLMKPDVLDLLSEVQLDCLTIDEAHCISDWGHDFRPEYRQLKDVRKRFPQAVCLAMTATATPRVRQDIKDNLHLQSAPEFLVSFNRPNLFYEVIPKASPINQTIDFLKRFRHQSGIIYCFSRKQVDALTAELKKEKFSVLPYHAGLNDRVRARNQERFIRDDVQIMVATIAFGMGINKPNVRFVVHFDLPKNVESYYQETGRAGRDGLPAHCLLLFGYGDIRKIRFFIDQKEDEQQQRVAQMHLNAIVHYAENETCRRIPLIRYFGEAYETLRCGGCDNCVNPREADFDMTLAARKLLTCIYQTGQRFGATHVIDVLRGSRAQKVLNYLHEELEVHGVGKEFTARQWQFMLRQLVQKEILRKEEEYGVLKLTPASFEILKNGKTVQGFPPPAEAIKSKAVRKKAVTDYDETLFEVLRKKRKQLADQKNLPPYVIFPDKTLIEMSAIKPQTKQDLAGIFGIGEKKLQTYGKVFLEEINNYVK